MNLRKSGFWQVIAAWVVLGLSVIDSTKYTLLLISGIPNVQVIPSHPCFKTRVCFDVDRITIGSLDLNSTKPCDLALPPVAKDCVYSLLLEFDSDKIGQTQETKDDPECKITLKPDETENTSDVPQIFSEVMNCFASRNQKESRKPTQNEQIDKLYMNRFGRSPPIIPQVVPREPRVNPRMHPSLYPQGLNT